MKGLYQFKRFDFDAFSDGKVYTVTGVRDWIDRDTGAHKGKRVDTVITADATPYNFRNGDAFSNIYEKLTFKVADDVSVAIGATVTPVDAVATCYGDYGNLLSVKCSGLIVTNTHAKGSKD